MEERDERQKKKGFLREGREKHDRKCSSRCLCLQAHERRAMAARVRIISQPQPYLRIVRENEMSICHSFCTWRLDSRRPPPIFILFLFPLPPPPYSSHHFTHHSTRFYLSLSLVLSPLFFECVYLPVGPSMRRWKGGFNSSCCCWSKLTQYQTAAETTTLLPCVCVCVFVFDERSKKQRHTMGYRLCSSDGDGGHMMHLFLSKRKRKKC